MGTVKAAFRALEFRRHLLPSIGLAAIAVYGIAKTEIGKFFGITLPDAPTWWLFSIGVVLVVAHAFLRRLQELENKLEPKISISNPIMHSIPKMEHGKAERRLFSVIVKNESGELVKNCQVKLLEMTNKDGGESFHHGRTFVRHADNFPIRNSTDIQTVFDIRPEDSEQIDIVEYPEKQSTQQLTICIPIRMDVTGTNSFPLWLVPMSMCPHDVTIGVFADNTIPVRKKFSFYVGEDGLLKLEVL